MIDINDLEALEKYFSENLKSPLFPILSDLYFQKGVLTEGHTIKQ